MPEAITTYTIDGIHPLNLRGDIQRHFDYYKITIYLEKEYIGNTTSVPHLGFLRMAMEFYEPFIQEIDLQSHYVNMVMDT